jgi:hypothetical protein
VFVNSSNTQLIQVYSPYQRVRRKRSIESQSTPHLSQHGGCPSTQGGTLLTTLINVLAAQDGHLSVTAKVTIVMTTVFCGSMFTLIVVYNLLLNKIITEHDRQVARNGQP